MSKYKNTEELVKEILTEKPETRDSDKCLYKEVIRETYPQALCWPVLDFLVNERHIPVPPFKTVERCRRKVQEKYPHLAASEKVKAIRHDEELDAYDYAKGREQ